MSELMGPEHRNLKDRRLFAEHQPGSQTVQQVVAQLPWVDPHKVEVDPHKVGDDPHKVGDGPRRRLVAAGRLAYTIPMLPQRPNQKYTVPEAL